MPQMDAHIKSAICLQPHVMPPLLNIFGHYVQLQAHGGFWVFSVEIGYLMKSDP